MSDEPREDSGPAATEPRPRRSKTLDVLGMLLFLGLAFLMAGLSYEEIMGPISYPAIAGIIGLTALGSGFAGFLYGYRVFMPAERHGWIKNKPRYTAVLSFVFVLLIIFNLPHYHHIRSHHYNSEAKHALHQTFLACQAYWKEKGSDKECDLNMVSQRQHKFVPGEYVTVDGKGTAKNFTATARHAASRNTFTIDADGKISKAR